MSDQITATYDRPTEATLMVRLANGEEWEATHDDLLKFGVAPRTDVYNRFRSVLQDFNNLMHFQQNTTSEPIEKSSRGFTAIDRLLQYVAYADPEHEISADELPDFIADALRIIWEIKPEQVDA